MDDEDPGLRGLLIRAREVIEESSPGNDVLIADMDRAIDGGAGSFSVGIARCQLRGCGRAWWAISEEVGNTARLSGFECPHCGGLDGRYEGERVRRSTEQEARAVAEQMRNEVSDYEQWLDAEEREWATKAPFSVVRRALADRLVHERKERGTLSAACTLLVDALEQLERNRHEPADEQQAAAVRELQRRIAIGRKALGFPEKRTGA
jgi:hypothetical protein